MILIDGVEIYIREIEQHPGESHRDAERAAINSVVSEIFGRETVVSHYDDGAPYIDGFDGTISISHSRHIAVIAVDRAGRHIGVDVESWRVALLNVAPRLLSVSERRWMDSNTDLLAAWTVKEAVYKALRPAGMSMLEVELPALPATIGVASGVEFTTVTIAPDTLLTVAIQYPSPSVYTTS
ncbi:MAG: 4'-phosphopantetheinyl transferase superfamily protein [Muribaculum sp.]|nr:4'-phosphopantetheinyl transferase superfamily protein [Muribaculum sp.]